VNGVHEVSEGELYEWIGFFAFKNGGMIDRKKEM